jgi:hypothetical protein
MYIDICISLHSRISNLASLIFNRLLVHSSVILCSCGVMLISAGIINLVEGQRNPEPAMAQNPEPAFAGFPEPVLGFSLPEAAIAQNPELSQGSLPETARGFGLPESAVAQNPELSPGSLPEIIQTDRTNIQPLENSPPEPLEADYDDSLNRFAAGNMLMFIEGAFGALVMIGAGLGAIMAAAFGAYKAAITLLFVAVGAFILRALVSLFFGTDYDAYRSGGIEFVGGGL